MVNVTATIFRGIGQIVLQGNAVSGVLLVLGITINSLPMGLAAVVGSATGTLLAIRLRFPRDELEQGLYGYNSALVALAACSLYALSGTAIAAAACGMLFATVLMRALHKRGLVPLTFPFVIAVWLMLACLALLDAGRLPAAASAGTLGLPALDAIAGAFGRVLFQANPISGLVFLLAVAAGSPRAALFGICGAGCAWSIGYLLQWPAHELSAGLYGVNAVLCAIALSMLTPKLTHVLAGCVLATLLTKAAIAAGLVALTAPFIVSTWAILALDRFRPKPQLDTRPASAKET